MKRSATIIECDNPRCGYSAEETSEGPDGFFIHSVGQSTPTGGWGAEDIYACREACIKPAILARLQETRDA